MLSTTLEAGKLRHRIDIVRPNLTQDSAGGSQPDDDSIFATVWARVEALDGRELLAAQQLVSEVTHKITIRQRRGVKSSMNVWFDNREFQIQAIKRPEERRKLLILLCVERDDSALEQGESPA